MLILIYALTGWGVDEIGKLTTAKDTHLGRITLTFHQSTGALPTQGSESAIELDGEIKQVDIIQIMLTI